MLNPSTFYSVLTPMFYTTNFLGLTPFSINSETCENSNVHLFWSLSFMFFINIYAFTAIDISTIDHKFIEAITDILDTYLGLGGMCFGILFGCIFRNDILSVLQSIEVFDKTVQIYLHIDTKQEYQSSKIYSVLGLLITLVFAIMLLTFQMFTNIDLFTFKLFGEFVGYTAPYIIITFVDLQFCTLTLCLKQRFSWLNKNLIAVSSNLESNLEYCAGMLHIAAKRSRVRPTTYLVTTGVAQDKALYLIEKIRSNHYQLCRISKTLNKAYSIQILVMVLQDFITIIVTIYYSGINIMAETETPIKYLFYATLQFSIALGQLLALVVSCSATATEARQTGVLLHKIMPSNGHIKSRYKEELQLEVAVFSLQLLHHTVEFTACRIFIIDETLIFSIVGAITTYLVIVTQFESANIPHHPT